MGSNTERGEKMNNNIFKVQIKALTPIWTGDANKKSSTLRETGILGSLRWWYEALIRGLKGTACDPTDTKCDGKNHCDACELFGCTGWARKFKLEVEKLDEELIFKFIPLREIVNVEWGLLNTTFNIISNYGALGAHIAQGNGVIKIIENKLSYQNEKLIRFSSNKESDDRLPNLNKFFFYNFHIKFTNSISELINNKVFWTHTPDHTNFTENWDSWKKLWDNYHFLPIAFHIRDAIRHLENDKDKRHDIFGRLGKGSKVFVSHGYKIDDKVLEVRIWGYSIKNEIKGCIKDEIENKLKEKLFSKAEYKCYLESCTLIEEKEGDKLLEELT